MCTGHKLEALRLSMTLLHSDSPFRSVSRTANIIFAAAQVILATVLLFCVSRGFIPSDISIDSLRSHYYFESMMLFYAGAVGGRFVYRPSSDHHRDSHRLVLMEVLTAIVLLENLVSFVQILMIYANEGVNGVTLSLSWVVLFLSPFYVSGVFLWCGFVVWSATTKNDDDDDPEYNDEDAPSSPPKELWCVIV